MDFEVDKEYDLDGSLDLSETDKYDFDGSLDLSEADKYDFDGSLDLSEADKYDFDGSLDFSETEKDEKDKNDDQNEEYNKEDYIENIGSQSTSTVLTDKMEEIESNMEHQEKEEEIEIRPEEYQGDQNNKEEQEAEELRQEVTEESIKYTEITFTREEFEYLWEVRDKLDQEGKTSEEIEEVLHEAEEMYETLKNAERLYEEQELEKLKLVDHQDEASEEDLKEQLDGMGLIERIVQLEEGLVQQMVLQEEIDVSVEEAIEGTIETAEFEEKVEKLIEEQNLKEEVRVEPFIKEALETEPESIVNEKEIEKLQEMDIEEQFQTVRLNDYVGELVERQEEEAEQLKEQEEKEELEAQANKIKEANSALYELVEVERDMLDQHEVEATIEEVLETEPESIFNEKEIEKLQETGIEEQFQMVRLNEYVEELVLVERQEEDKNIENDKIEQEKENIEQTQDVIHQSTYLQEKLEEQEQELEWEYEEKDIVEQHQVEAAIEEELKTEPKPIINEEELECIKNSEPEKQLEAELFYEFIEELANKQNEEKEEREENEEQEEISTEQKVAQIMPELGIPQEINSGETEVESNSQKGELELKTTSLDEEMVEQLEIEERRDQQQELEEILEQNRKIEQEALKEIESGEEDSDKTAGKYYEKTKKLYTQQTEKRPIYANKETKGFKQWLEQKKKSEEKEKTKQKKELKEEQKKEEDWKTTLKQWIKEASEEECNADLKSELKKALESYNKFEDLARKFLELHEKAQNEKLSEKERNRLKSLTDRLHELDPIQFELLLSVFFIKKYITEQYGYDFWNTPFVNLELSKFFKHISQKILKLKKAQENKENLEVLKLELDTIGIESKDKKDFLEEITKLRSEESDEEEDEPLQELYRQETGRRSIYARKKPKGYSQWLQQRELRAEKIKISKSESEKKKEIKEEGWKTTLKKWIKEASEEESNAELKSELKKALESYNEFEYLTRKFLELYKKSQYEKLTEIEKNRLKFLTERLQGLGPIQLELLANIRAFKDYFYNHLWEFMNRFFVNRVRSKFFKHISQKYKELKKEQKNKKIKNLIQKIPSSIDENDNISSKNILKKFPQENIHLLESFSSISSKIKAKFKNIKITNYSIIESCDLSQNFRKSGILTKESFEKLQNLLGRSIEHESILGSYRKNKVLNLRHSRKLAEFIGILIAKGHIEKDRIRISLSGVCKNQIFLDYIKDLLIEIFLLKEERLYFKFSKDTSYIRVNSIVVPHELRKLGVISETSNVPVIPKWIFTRKEFIVSCLKGMFEIAGQIIVNSRGSLEIRFIRPKRFIVECFRDLCFRLGLELSRIYSYQRKMEIYSNNSSISKKFYVSMSKKASLKRFFNLISTLKWELSKDRIQSMLEDRGSSIAEVLEFKFKYDKRDKILRQAPFEYNLDYLCHIPNPIIIQKLADLFHIIEDRLFSLDMFGKDSLRCSMFRIKGSQKMKLLSSFFKPYEDYLLNGNYVIVDSKNGQNLSQMILDAEIFYKNKDTVFSISNNIKHYFLQRFAFKFKHRFDSILASELLLWSEVNDNQNDINHITGHVDYLVYDPSCETFYLCDYKPDENSFLPIIPQVAMYGVLFKKLLDLKNINVKCIVFNKKHSWEFDPFIIDSRIPYIVNELKKKGFPIESIWRIIFQ